MTREENIATLTAIGIDPAEAERFTDIADGVRAHISLRRAVALFDLQKQDLDAKAFLLVSGMILTAEVAETSNLLRLLMATVKDKK